MAARRTQRVSVSMSHGPQRSPREQWTQLSEGAGFDASLGELRKLETERAAQELSGEPWIVPEQLDQAGPRGPRKPSLKTDGESSNVGRST